MTHLIMLAAVVFAQWVNPWLGSDGHGHVFVGASVPQGMVSVGPTQLRTGWDWCSGYHWTGDSIVGFAQTHLSGTGCADLGDIALMPSVSEVELSRQGMAAPFRHEREVVEPGYYSVTLDGSNILCEMTATERVALHRYTFARGCNNARVIIDLDNGIGDRCLRSRIYQLDLYTVAGWRESAGWVGRHIVYFYIQFSKPIHNWLSAGLHVPYAQATFEVGPGDDVMARVALSPTSEMMARLNMSVEMPRWDFKAVRQQALETWEDELGRVDATFDTERERRIFYTAMYHYLMAPTVWCDQTGDYMGADGRVKLGADYATMSTWSLWDTYRAAHPLATLIQPDRMTDYAHTLLAIAREQGELPVWHLASGETHCMVGCPAVPVLADMVMKGLGGVDAREAHRAIKASLERTDRGLAWMNRLGYVPCDVGEGESVAKTLEYALAFWSGAQVAGLAGEKEDSVRWTWVSQQWRRLFDQERHFMRPATAEGALQDATGFDPCHQTRDYTEGTPWQYAWLVPHDVHGLIAGYPSEDSFAAHLDSLFTASSTLNEGANPDITGLIGQYAQGNEPDHHAIYLYNYVGQPWKAAERLHQVMDSLYTDLNDGLCGNEDAGQMSAWYIMSALGLYQVQPAGGIYVLGSPTVREATLRVGPDTTFTIRRHGEGIYVESVKLNGRNHPQSWLRHEDIARGGTLDFHMSRKPTAWGTKPEHRP